MRNTYEALARHLAPALRAMPHRSPNGVRSVQGYGFNSNASMKFKVNGFAFSVDG
jgi:hypothetical protein